jgi:TPR repeat protein
MLFKNPPAKEDCPICFLPLPVRLFSCASLPDATVSSVPIYDFAMANEELEKMDTVTYYLCCGKSICKGCIHSCRTSGNDDKCPFCNSDRGSNTDEEGVEEIRKRVGANDPGATCLLAYYYSHGLKGLQQDHSKAIELYTRSANLGFSQAHNNLAGIYSEGGVLKKAKFHFEAAAMAGHEVARYNLGSLEANSGNLERAIKHWTIAASAGEYLSMHALITFFEEGVVSRESINSTLAAYNNSCAEIRSEARDACIALETLIPIRDGDN